MAKIEVFSGQNCSYCTAAKNLLDQRGLAYTEYDISTDEGHRKEFSRRLPRARSIPQIFINDEHVGGFDDLAILDKAGTLAEMTGDSDA